MRALHLEKKGLRGLAIAESFKPNCSKSIFSGVVMRGDFVIDGFVFGIATLEGNDATEAVLKMYDKLQRADIRYVLISGLVVSMYNMIDIQKLHQILKIPIIGISYRDSAGIEDAIRYHFPDSFESKISLYQNLGKREKITLNTSFDVFVRKEGCTLNDVKNLLDKLTLHGSVPEPIRVSKLLAKTLLLQKLLP